MTEKRHDDGEMASMAERGKFWRIVAAAIFIVFLQAVIASVVYFSLPNWETRSHFGDMFGVVNALFSGLAFAGLIYAIVLQREDLTLQRKELELTRVELARTAKAQEAAEAALRAQAETASQSARLSAMNYLLEHYNTELAQFKGHAIPAGDPRLLRLRELHERKRALLSMLDETFTTLIRKE